MEVVRGGSTFQPTSRVKTTGTILDKVERHGGSILKSMQDLAGMRIVEDFALSEQDEAAQQLKALFAPGPRPSKLIDRRAAPSSGYRAVHVIVFVGEIPVEIQVRTTFQHGWAELYEKTGDLVGRGIRYGEPLDSLEGQTAAAVAERNLGGPRLPDELVSDLLATVASLDKLQATYVDGLHTLSVLIAKLEELRDLRPDHDLLPEMYAEVQDSLESAQKRLTYIERAMTDIASVRARMF